MNEEYGYSITVQMFLNSIPKREKNDPVVWGQLNVRLIGSARTEEYDPMVSPWNVEPLRRSMDGVTRVLTYVKPVQAGGSTVGEVLLCYIVANAGSGDIQYNWESDEKALERWDKRVEKILKACKPVAARWPKDRTKVKRGMVIFPAQNFTIQGAFNSSNLDSDSIRFQINEEVHNWEDGRLAKAYNRTTAFWNSLIVNISNAGWKGGQLHRAFLAGSQQHWEVKCPGCGQYHEMRTRWEEERPHLGGLRYDATGCRLGDGLYDYPKLARTIRYQFPCGHQIPDDYQIRRQLSLTGRYGAPKNPGAPPGELSYTLDAVSVDWISWLTLIREKHSALLAMKMGDPVPYRKYVMERECLFYDLEDQPMARQVIVSKGLRKAREGLPDRVLRGAMIDRQQGSLLQGVTPHYWLTIRDARADASSRLVFEGRIDTEADLVATIRDHGVRPFCVLADTGYDTTHMYNLCLQNGWTALKGSDQEVFHHEDGGRRIFSPPKPLHMLMNIPPSRENPEEEPLFYLYSKYGIRERLYYLQNGGIPWEVPEDVSDAYKSHNSAEEAVLQRTPEGFNKLKFVQRKDRNDLYVCECYFALLLEITGLIGDEALKRFLDSQKPVDAVKVTEQAPAQQ